MRNRPGAHMTAKTNLNKSTYTVTADQLVAWPGPRFRHESSEQNALLFGNF